MTAIADQADDELPDVLTSADITYEARITYRQCDYWVRLGFLRPECAMGGSGTHRRWPLAELGVARRMGALVKLGFPLEAAHDVARSGESRTQVAPGIWLEFGPALSEPCEHGDCEGCFPEESAACGHGCHDGDRT